MPIPSKYDTHDSHLLILFLKKYCLYFSDVYVAAALMEYFCTKDKKVASNIFELGFKKYKDKVGFVTHYLDFLIHLNGK